MTIKEKINLIDSMENSETFNDENFQTLCKYITDENNIVRSRCACMLKNFQTQDSLDLLINLCNDTDAFVRTETYDALSSFSCKRTEKTLYQAIQSETDNVARSYAIFSWSKVAHCIYSDYSASIQFLSGILFSEKSERCKLYCLCGMYYLNYVKVLPEILEFIESEDYTIRYSALNLLAEITRNNDKNTVISAVKRCLHSEETIAVRSAMEKLITTLEKYNI